MASISIEGTSVAEWSSVSTSSFPIALSGHLYLVYRDDQGHEFVIRGGPTPTRSATGDIVSYGDLRLEINVPIEQSVDRRVDNNGNPVTPDSRGHVEIALGDRQASDVWNLLIQFAQAINDHHFPYAPTGDNSNGTAGNLLALAGIDVNNVLPDPDGVMLLPFYGRTVPFDFNYSITGTDHNDKIFGRGGDQTFYGSAGHDELHGGLGSDTVIFAGLRTDYTITTPNAQGTVTVRNVLTGATTDVFSDIEHVKFDSTTGNYVLNKTFVAGSSISIPANDDGSSPFVSLTPVFKNGINFLGHHYDGLYVNNNGNITFGAPLSTFTPTQIGGSSGLAIIAPFWADVDTRHGGSQVTYGFDTEHGAFVATWQSVDYYDATATDHQPKFDSFQLELVNQGEGDFDVVFRYNSINWTSGDASSGTSGLGGVVATAGFSSGDGVHYFELPESGIQREMLSLGQEMGAGRGISGPGTWHFIVQNGNVAGIGTSGNDRLDGTNGDDFIDGGAGDDVINGGQGNDTLVGGSGNDFVNGGTGNDTLIAGHGEGNDHYDGGADTDTITFTSTTAGVAVDLNQGIADSGETGHDNVVNIENVVGGSGPETITGDNNANQLTGGPGDDFLDGAGGDDTAIFSGVRADYTVRPDSRGFFLVTDNRPGSPDGTDTLSNIELLQFSDALQPLHVITRAERFFDTATSDHFYTLSVAEADQIRATLPTYHDEGAPWGTPDKGTDTIDVFRFFDVATGAHFLTTSTAERDQVLATLPSYHFEGVGFEAYTAPGDGTLTLERFFNTQSHLHHYAASAAEIASIQSGGAGPGWVDEGAGFIVHT
jgi:Ca2+-binding RTX toxin-like protein